MSIQTKYNHLEQAYPDMLAGIAVLIQKGKLTQRFDSISLTIEEKSELEKAKSFAN